MTIRLKYVIIKDEFENEQPFIFPEKVVHREAAFYFHRSGNVVSAGFFEFDGKEVFVFDKSESLKVGSRKEDAEIIKKMLGIKEIQFVHTHEG